MSKYLYTAFIFTICSGGCVVHSPLPSRSNELLEVVSSPSSLLLAELSRPVLAQCDHVELKDALRVFASQVGTVEHVEPTGIVDNDARFIPADALIRCVRTPHMSLVIATKVTTTTIHGIALGSRNHWVEARLSGHSIMECGYHPAAWIR